VVFLVILLKPPYPHSEAQSLTDTQINNPVQEVPKQEQTVEAVANEVKPTKQAPQPKPPKPAPAVVHPVGCSNYSDLVGKYDWNQSVALAVAKAESSCNPNAVGDNYVIGGIYAPSCGLFQIRTLPGRPSCEELKNPETNVAWAYRLYNASGWQPWSVCNKGIVSCY